MRRVFLILLILLQILSTAPARAQSDVQFVLVSVDIMPEYDRPSVLVIYHLSLSPKVVLPTTIDLRLPSLAEVYAVAIVDPLNGLLNTPYDRQVQGDWATLSISVTSPELQVEYYDQLSKDETARHIVYEWPGDYQVDSFSVVLQQPIGAEELVTYPSLSSGNRAADGFVYFQSTPQSLTLGQPYTLIIDYTKQTDALSTTGLSVQPAQSLDVNTPGRITTSGALPWGLAILGFILLVLGIVGGMYMWRSGVQKTTKGNKRHSRNRRQQEDQVTYCQQCGKRTQPGDVFCRTCGIRLKIEK